MRATAWRREAVKTMTKCQGLSNTAAMTGPQSGKRMGDKMNPVQMKAEIVSTVVPSSAQGAIMRTQLSVDMAVRLT